MPAAIALPAAHEPPEIVFNATITPHRSLSPRQLFGLFCALSALTLVMGVRFWFLGAWPVTLFGLVEVGLIGTFFWVNHRGARAEETVTLYPDQARIARRGPSGRRWETTLSTAWLTVELEEKAHAVTRLWLCHRGRREEIGGALDEDAKRDLAGAIRGALESWRNPRFDNPQLRG